MAENQQSAATPQPPRASRPSRPDAPAAEEIDYTQPAQVSLWQHPFVQNVLPFVTSFLLHAGIIVLGIATAKAVQTVTQVVKEQIIIPDATIVEGAEVGGVPNPGLGSDPNVTSDTQLEVQDLTPRTQENKTLTVGDLGGGDVTAGVIGKGSGGTAALRPGSGSGLGSGEATGTPFGAPGGGGNGPRVSFIGASGNATRIVFLCDASGTMLPSFPMLRQELYRTLEKLQPIQFFNIIFFHGNDDGTSVVESVEGFPNGLVAATPENKSKAHTWIRDSGPKGNTDPFPAIERAFAMKPQLIFVLTDGFDNVSSYEAVRAAFKKANSDGQVKVNTILLQSPPPTLAGSQQSSLEDEDSKRLEGVLRNIADDHGGRFKTVKPD